MAVVFDCIKLCRCGVYYTPSLIKINKHMADISWCANLNRLTSQLYCCPRRFQTEKHRRVQRAAPGSPRWIRRSMETGVGSATHSPRRAGRRGPLVGACCWSRPTGRSAAGKGGLPGIGGKRGETGHEEKCKDHDVYDDSKMDVITSSKTYKPQTVCKKTTCNFKL